LIAKPLGSGIASASPHGRSVDCRETDPVTHDDFADETDCLEGGHSEKGVVLVLHELEQGRNEFGPPLDGQLNRRDRRDDLRGDASCLLDW
jgi:hypothetical protein